MQPHLIQNLQQKLGIVTSIVGRIHLRRIQLGALLALQQPQHRLEHRRLQETPALRSHVQIHESRWQRSGPEQRRRLGLLSDLGSVQFSKQLGFSALGPEHPEEGGGERRPVRMAYLCEDLDGREAWFEEELLERAVLFRRHDQVMEIPEE